MSIDSIIIEHCSPTLARLKMASLLCLPKGKNDIDYDVLVEKYNQKHNVKGLYFRILYRCSQRTLLYMYRPAMVDAYVHRKDVAAFLASFGYPDSSVEDMLDFLSRRFADGGCFPHESGVFLGYPLEDVLGFITHKGNHAKACGEWKVYGDAEAACRVFRTYDHCRNVYRRCFSRGSTLESLIVA